MLRWRAADWNRRLSPVVFRYFRCPGCGLVFLADPPPDLDRYYPDDYYTLPASATDVARAAALERYKIELVQRFVRGGRLIEIGPGRGNFCYLAREAGFEVMAVERSTACRAFLTAALGVAAAGGEDEHAALESLPSADVIAMWHVLEHLADPWRFLALAAARLKPGGVLVVATPNPECFQFRVFGARWTHLDAPRHLALIPPRLLARTLAAARLEALLLTSADPGSLGWNRFGWAFSCANLFAGRGARRLARAAGRVLALAAAPAERIEGCGAAYTAIFRKAAR